MAGRNNTTRIELLESEAANLSARLNVLDVLVEGISDLLKKGTADAESHTSRITVIEQKILVLVELKSAKEAIASIEKELISVRKDLESLGKWKDELKKDKDEASRRKAAFGPNVTAAFISGFITILGIVIAYFLNKPK